MSSPEVNKADKLLKWLNQQALDVINTEPLQEALTHTSAGRSSNHEELEFLGDAVPCCGWRQRNTYVNTRGNSVSARSPSCGHQRSLACDLR